MCYQIIVVLEGVVQGGDPLAVPIYQHVPLLPKTRRLNKEAINSIKYSVGHVKTCQAYVPVIHIYNRVIP